MANTESFAVLGLGKFGTNICLALAKAGQDVLAVDANENVINNIASVVMRAVVADVTDEKTLEELNIASFDHVYITLEKNVEGSIMATLLAKEMGVKDITCRATSQNHARVLEKVGATRVIQPEKDMAEQLVFQHLHPNVVNYVHIAMAREPDAQVID